MEGAVKLTFTKITYLEKGFVSIKPVKIPQGKFRNYFTKTFVSQRNNKYSVRVLISTAHPDPSEHEVLVSIKVSIENSVKLHHALWISPVFINLLLPEV